MNVKYININNLLARKEIIKKNIKYYKLNVDEKSLFKICRIKIKDGSRKVAVLKVYIKQEGRSKLII